MNNQLTEKQRRFCEEYIIDMNGKQAAIRVGYNEKTAESQASRLLRNAKVKEYLGLLREKLKKKLEISQERVLLELARIGMSDIRKFYNPDGSLKKITELDDDSAAALAGVDVDEAFILGTDGMKVIQTKKIKRFNKIEALANINKMMGWNAPEKIEHTGDSFLDLLMKTSATNTSENEPRQKKKPKPKAKKPATKSRRKK